jgi:hypothetical protein
MTASRFFQGKHPLSGFGSGATGGKLEKQRAAHLQQTRFYAIVGRCMTKSPIPILA